MGAVRWIKQGGERLGPFSDAELRQMAREARLRPDSLLSLDGQKWLRASHVPGLFPPAKGRDTPPPLPRQGPQLSAPAPVDLERPVLDMPELETAPAELLAVIAPPVLETLLDVAVPPLPISSDVPLSGPMSLASVPATLEIMPARPSRKSLRRRWQPLLMAAAAGVLLGVLTTGALWCFGVGRAGAPSKATVATGIVAAHGNAIARTDHSPSGLVAVQEQTANQQASNQPVTSAMDGLAKVSGSDAQAESKKLPESGIVEPAKPAAGVIAVADVVPATATAPLGSSADQAMPATAKPEEMKGAADAAKAAAAQPMPQQPPAGLAKPVAVAAGNVNVAGPPGKPMGPPPAANDRGRRRMLVMGNGGTPASEAAVEAALAWLAAHQLADGGWSFDHRLGNCHGHCPDPGTMVDVRNAATAMGLLPFLAAGYNHEQGPYKEQIWAGLSYLITHMGADGSLWEPGGTMYSQGLATTALCDAFNMSTEKPTPQDFLPSANEPVAPAAKRDAKEEKLAKAEAAKAAKAERAAKAKARMKPAEANAVAGAETKPLSSADPTLEEIKVKKLRALQLGIAAQKALDYIVAAQNAKTGGWRYMIGEEGDTSVVGWQLMALKAGLLADLRVPPQTLAGASNFLDFVQSEYGSVYGYTGPARGTPATTAIGLLARENLGWDAANPALIRGAERLAFIGPSEDDMYYNFYANQVLRNFDGPIWAKWNPVMRDYLVKTQGKNGHLTGSWMFFGSDRHAQHGTQAGGRLYNTALCTLILEVYYRHEPTYSRPTSSASKNLPVQQAK